MEGDFLYRTVYALKKQIQGYFLNKQEENYLNQMKLNKLLFLKISNHEKDEFSKKVKNVSSKFRNLGIAVLTMACTIHMMKANDRGIPEIEKKKVISEIPFLNIFQIPNNNQLDTDGDGILDSVDIDDDNDGVLDVMEGGSVCGEAVISSNGSFDEYTSLPDYVSQTDRIKHWFQPTGPGARGLTPDYFYRNVYDYDGRVKDAHLPTEISDGYVSMYCYSSGISEYIAHELVSSISSGETIAWSLDLTPQNENANYQRDMSFEVYGVPLRSSLPINISGATSPTALGVGAVLLDTYDFNSLRSSEVTKASGEFVSPGNFEVIILNIDLGGLNFVRVVLDNFSMSDKGSVNCGEADDTDNDGIPNSLDLDSDGDGCSDSIEAGNTEPTNNDIINYNTGTDANRNGLLDKFEEGTSGDINYTSTYIKYALQNAVKSCNDTDGDGIPDSVDIDDDNDGVLDTMEGASSCSEVLISSNGSFDEYTSLPDYVSQTDRIKHWFQPSSNTPDYFYRNVYDYDGRVEDTHLPTEISDGYVSMYCYRSGFSEYIAHELVSRMNSGDNITWSIDLTPQNVNANYEADMKFEVYGVPLRSSLPVIQTEPGALHPKALGVHAILLDSRQIDSLRSSELTKISGEFVSPGNFEVIILSIDLGGLNFVRIVLDNFSMSDTRSITCGEADDTDNDGIPNSLDLDSDGDGCSDSIEAGNTELANNDIVNYNTCIDANRNGLLDKFEEGTSGNINYTSTYTQYALSNTSKVCNDTDGDGIPDSVDIDDDNDGVLDTMEGGSICSDKLISSNGSFDEYTSLPDYVSQTDRIKHWFQPSSNTPDYFYRNVYDYDGRVEDTHLPAEISDGYVSMYCYRSGVSEYIAHELVSRINSGDNITWSIDLTPQNVNANYESDMKFEIYGVPLRSSLPVIQTEPGALHPKALGVHAVLLDSKQIDLLRSSELTKISGEFVSPGNFEVIILNIDLGGLNFVRVVLDNFSMSDKRSVNCGEADDTDNDGIPNSLDLDSDGDGCSDSIEAGNTDLSNNDIVNYNTGIDANRNGLLDKFEEGTSGGINYTSTYTQYALSNTSKVCNDTDGDGIPDSVDIDDDNDGVLDTMEGGSVCSDTLISSNGSFDEYTLLPDQVSQTDRIKKWFQPSGLTPDYLYRGVYDRDGFPGWEHSHLPSEISDGFVNMYCYRTGISEYIAHELASPISSGETITWSIDLTAGVEDGDYQRDMKFEIYGVPLRSSLPANNNQEGVFHPTELGVGAVLLDTSQFTSLKGTEVTKVSGEFVSSGNFEVIILNVDLGGLNFVRIYLDNFSMLDKGSVNCGEADDTDNDGIPNSLDLDSDGDGCSDSIEAGNTEPTNNDIINYNTGTDVNKNGLLDKFEEGTSGNINYTSTYTQYALDKTVKICKDPEPENTTNAVNDNFTMSAVNIVTTGNVLTNDYDIEGHTQEVKVNPVNNVSNGRLWLNKTGSFVYRPNTGFTGTDSFVYEVCDNGSPQACDQATVRITVRNTTNAVDDNFTITTEDPAATGNVLSNDYDSEGHTQQIVTTPVRNVSNGRLWLVTSGVFVYQPNAGFIGTDSFVYEVCDNGSPQACDQATVRITVEGVSEPADFAPVLFTGKTIVNGSKGRIDFVIAVSESNSQDSDGITPVEVRIPDSTSFNFTFESGLTTLNGTSVNNADWNYVLEGGLHKFIFVGNGGVFPGNTLSRIGVKAIFNSPQNSKGQRPLKVTIKSDSGGQTNIRNDNDEDIIRYNNSSSD